MTDEKNQALFAQLVIMFQGACMQYLGKLKNPMTDEVQKDLEQAQAMIDLLEMLHIRTKGNLSAEEQTFLSGVIRELKLNYIDEAGKGGDTPQGQTS